MVKVTFGLEEDKHPLKNVLFVPKDDLSKSNPNEFEKVYIGICSHISIILAIIRPILHLSVTSMRAEVSGNSTRAKNNFFLFVAGLGHNM